MIESQVERGWRGSRSLVLGIMLYFTMVVCRCRGRIWFRHLVFMYRRCPLNTTAYIRFKRSYTATFLATKQVYSICVAAYVRKVEQYYMYMQYVRSFFEIYRVTISSGPSLLHSLLLLSRGESLILRKQSWCLAVCPLLRSRPMKCRLLRRALLKNRQTKIGAVSLDWRAMAKENNRDGHC